MLFCLQGFSQVVNVGNGNDSNRGIPIFFDDSTSSFIQQIFTSQEITQNGLYINGISLTTQLSSYQCLGNFTLYIGTTTESSFVDGFIPLEQMIKVIGWNYYDVFSYTYTDDSITLNNLMFDRAFLWDGYSNIVLTFIANKANDFICHSDSLGYLSHLTSDQMTRKAYLTYPNTFIIDSTPSSGQNSYERNNIDFIFTSCPDAFNLNVSEITTNQAKVSWEEIDTFSTWMIEYAFEGNEWVNAHNAISNNNYIYLDSLSENRTYIVRLRKECNDSTFSSWKEIKFKTGCHIIDTIPFSYEFSSMSNSTPLCWKGDYSLYNGSVDLNFYSTDRAYFISPSITENINNLSVKFYGKQSSTFSKGVKLSFGVMSDDNDTSTFVALFDTITEDNPCNWNLYEVNIDNDIVLGENNYIAFRAEQIESIGSFSIGDIIIDYKLPCPNVYDFKVHGSSQNSISLKWNTTNNSHNGYQIAYSQYSNAFEPDNATIINLTSSSSPPFTISNLMPSTRYSIAIRQSCGGAWTIIDAYTMGLPATIPYSCDFENQEERNKWMISNGDAVNKWVFGQAVNNGIINGYSMYVSDNDGDSNTMNGNTKSVVTASRLFKSTGAGGYTVTFNSRVKGYYNYNVNNFLKAFVVDSNINFDGTDSRYLPYYATKDYRDGAILFGGDINSTSSASHNINFPYFFNNANPVVTNSHTINIPYQGENGVVKKLIFLWTNSLEYYIQRYYPAAIDNITIQENPCASPQISVVNTTSDNVELSWTSGYSDST